MPSRRRDRDGPAAPDERTPEAAGPDRPAGWRGRAGRHRTWRHRRLHRRAPAAALPPVSCDIEFRVGGAPAFGPEVYELLRAFQSTGSFSEAAAEMGVTYETAWRALRFCERRLRLRLVTRRSTGAAPGRSLTPRARTILKRYAAFAEQQAAILVSLAARLKGGA